MLRLEDYLFAYATRFPDKVAVKDSEKSLTYAALATAVKRKALRLQDLGVRPHSAVVFRASQTVDFLVTYMAIHWICAVAVPVEQDLPEERLLAIEQQCDGYQFAAEIADVLFTTGSTGQPKGVMISYQAWMADTDNLIRAQRYHADTIFVLAAPLNHFGALSKVYPTIVRGGSLRITAGLKDMSAFFAAFDGDRRVFASFLVPSALHLLLQVGRAQLEAISPLIDFIETGAAPMSLTDMQALCDLLPHTHLYNTYASTESGIVSTYDFQTEGPRTGCVGRPIFHSKVAITPENLIVCMGRTLMCGYLGDEMLTQQVLFDGQLFTNDQGMVDDEQRLYITGRVDDVINLGGYKVSPEEVEAQVLTLEGISECVCTHTTTAVGDALRLFYVLQPDAPSVTPRDIARHLSTRLERYKIPQLYEQTDYIRRTYNGKLDRRYYQ